MMHLVLYVPRLQLAWLTDIEVMHRRLHEAAGGGGRHNKSVFR